MSVCYNQSSHLGCEPLIVAILLVISAINLAFTCEKKRVQSADVFEDSNFARRSGRTCRYVTAAKPLVLPVKRNIQGLDDRTSEFDSHISSRLPFAAYSPERR